MERGSRLPARPKVAPWAACTRATHRLLTFSLRPRVRGHASPAVGRAFGAPVEQRAYDAAKLSREEALRGVAGTGILDVEGEDRPGAEAVDQLRCRERDGADVDLHQPLVAQVAGDPGRHEVFPGLGRPAPAGVRVQRVEDDVPLLVCQLDLRNHLDPAPANDEPHLDPYRLADVDGVHRRPRLVDDARRDELDRPASGSSGELAPRPLGADADLRLHVRRDDVLTRPGPLDLPELQPVDAVAEARDR